MIATSIQQRCKMKKFQLSSNWLLTLSKVEVEWWFRIFLVVDKKGRNSCVWGCWHIGVASKSLEVIWGATSSGCKGPDGVLEDELKTMNQYWSISRRCPDSVFATSGQCQLGGLATMWREVCMSCLQLSGSIDGRGVQTWNLGGSSHWNQIRST